MAHHPLSPRAASPPTGLSLPPTRGRLGGGLSGTAHPGRHHPASPGDPRAAKLDCPNKSGNDEGWDTTVRETRLKRILTNGKP